MPEIEPLRGRALRPGPRLAAAALAVLVTAALAPAAGYGDVDVTVVNEPRGTATHGYAEIEFLVVNRSAQAAHEVRLTHPKSSHAYRGSDHIRAVTRTATVEPGERVRVVIAYPEQLELSGSGTGVTVDGREYDDVLSVRRTSGAVGYSVGRSSPGGPDVRPLVLYSKSVDTRFPDWMNEAETQLRFEGKGTVSPEAVRAELSPDQWSPNWLGYSRYDGVVVTADDLRGTPPDVRGALGQYVECGGCLFVLGRDPPLPGPWKPVADREGHLADARPGFGRCFVTEQVDLSDAPAALFTPVLTAFTETMAPWRRTRTPSEANHALPVVEDVGVPVKGLLVLMLVFAVAIGPLNLIVLARKKRKLWLFWTVPVISLVTCLLVIVSVTLSEGWQGRTRIEGFTVLDENSRRASTLGWTGFYTPLLPSGGLHFSPETELSYQNGDDPHSYRRRRRSSGSGLTIDWTREQHLTSGWLTPRVPAHFVLRRSELRRERVTVAKGTGGALEAVNGLGANLSEFWYRDENGSALFHAAAIPAGERANLAPVPEGWRTGGVKPLRDIYAGDWSALPAMGETVYKGLLAPRTYIGVMESAPFMDDALPGASVRKARSVVYGILKEGGGGD